MGDAHLTEREVEVGLRHRRGVDDRQFAGENVGSAQAVDLTGIGTSEHLEDHAVALPPGRGEILPAEKDGLAGSAPHQDERQRLLFGGGPHLTRI